jgi:hypothetical protein
MLTLMGGAVKALPKKTAATRNAPSGEETDQRASHDRLSAAFKLTAASPSCGAARRLLA